jgi:hypothetical protein
MRNLIVIIVCFFIFISCENSNPAFRFSNFRGTQAEALSKAIEDQDINAIRHEVKQKKVNVNFEDIKYEVSLLELAVTNYKKEAFEELLRLGADPNIENSSCVSPLISAIRNNVNCDLYFIKRLIDNGAKIKPKFFEKCNYFSNDPIVETINYDFGKNEECVLKILKLLTSKLNDKDLLFTYNDPINYQANIVYNCLSTLKNLNALKYLIVDLKYKAPKEIFIDGTVLYNHDEGYVSLKEILTSKHFYGNRSENESKLINEILLTIENE